MKLNLDIIRSLIAEEISKSILNEVDPKTIENLAQTLARFQGELNLADPDQLNPIVQQAIQKLKNKDAANRRDVQEACGEMQSIDMSVDPDHSEDHEGSMAKRQMFKTAMYSKAILDMIDDGEEFPAWVQSKMTKIADYIGAVKHYLEYDEVMGEKLDPDADAGDYVNDFETSDAKQFRGKSKKKRKEMAIAAYLDAQDDK